MTTVVCEACNQEVPLNNFCGNCRTPLATPDSGNHLDQEIDGNHLDQEIDGHHNQGVQVGGNNSGTIILNSSEPEQEKTLIHRSFIKPVTIADKQVKAWWFFASGALSVVGSIASIIGTWMALASDAGSMPSPPSHWMFYVTVAGMLLLLSGFMLQRAKYITLPLVGKTIEADRYGNLFITKIAGTCGLCKSPVKVKTIGPKENRQTMVVCTNNPDQHLWHFDRTVLSDVGDDYRDSL